MTTIVGEFVAVWAVTPWRITVPPLTMIAGEFPVMTVPSARVTVPPLTMKSPAVALPSTVTFPPLTVQSTGATLAAIVTIPPLTVARLTVAPPADEEVKSTCTPAGTASVVFVTSCVPRLREMVAGAGFVPVAGVRSLIAVMTEASWVAVSGWSTTGVGVVPAETFWIAVTTDCKLACV